MTKFYFWYRNLRSFIIHHPNRLRITTMRRGWADCDHQLLHASMQILVNFVEGEKRGDIVDWDYDQGHREASAVLERLYTWWKHDPFAQDASLMPTPHDWGYGRAMESAPYAVIDEWILGLERIHDADLTWVQDIVKACRGEELNLPAVIDAKGRNMHRYYHCLNKIEAKAIERQDEALIDLIKVRGYLWT